MAFRACAELGPKNNNEQKLLRWLGKTLTKLLCSQVKLARKKKQIGPIGQLCR